MNTYVQYGVLLHNTYVKLLNTDSTFSSCIRQKNITSMQFFWHTKHRQFRIISSANTVTSQSYTTYRTRLTGKS